MGDGGGGATRCHEMQDTCGIGMIGGSRGDRDSPALARGHHDIIDTARIETGDDMGGNGVGRRVDNLGERLVEGVRKQDGRVLHHRSGVGHPRGGGNLQHGVHEGVDRIRSLKNMEEEHILRIAVRLHLESMEHGLVGCRLVPSIPVGNGRVGAQCHIGRGEAGDKELLVQWSGHFGRFPPSWGAAGRLSQKRLNRPSEAVEIRSKTTM
ncbi:MAG: hypothetical protein MZV64_30470 [Ignavibacteriales bacterium]|nr:hypothetical protein [Ignavibacteriales bacterium]